MNRLGNRFFALAMAAAFVLSMAGFAEAQKRNEREVRDAVRSLMSKIDDFEYDLRFQMQSSSADNGQIAEVTDDIRSLKDEVRQFQKNLDQRRENRDDVSRMIDMARPIDEFMRDVSQNRRVEDGWKGVRTQLGRIAANYGLTTDWDADGQATPTNDYPDTVQKNTMSVGLSGTYDLDRARSESVDDIVSATALGNEQRDDLKEKLVAPAQMAIDIRGNQVTLATSNASPVTFIADGRDKVEQSGGKTLRLRATMSGQVLTVSSLSGETDYTITFTSASNGQVLKVS